MPRFSTDFALPDGIATEALGQALARALPGEPARGGVLYLQGDLGTGKTTCARSLLRALGVTGLVRSPTYTLVETYAVSDLNCIHVDLYRLQAPAEVEELGAREWSGPGCLLLVEWPDRGVGALPPADLKLDLRYAGNGREARLCTATPLGSAWLANLGSDTSLSFYVSNIT